MSLGAPSSPTPPVSCAVAGSCLPQNPSGNGGRPCCAGSSGSARSDCPPHSSFSAHPVRYINGEVQVVNQDLTISGFGVPWGHTRSYSNQLTNQADGTNGNSWRVKEWPYVVEVTSTSVCVVNGTIYDALWFDLVGSAYVPCFYVQDTLVHDTTNQQYIHTDTLGRVTTFYDYNAAIPAAQQGQFKSFTDLGGNVTTASYDATTHLITSFMRSSGGASSGLIYGYYSTSGANSGQLQYATVQVNGNNVRQVEYDYYGSSDTGGSLNDLMRATIRQWNGSAWDITPLASGGRGRDTSVTVAGSNGGPFFETFFGAKLDKILESPPAGAPVTVKLRAGNVAGSGPFGEPVQPTAKRTYPLVLRSPFHMLRFRPRSTFLPPADRLLTK